MRGQRKKKRDEGAYGAEEEEEGYGESGGRWRRGVLPSHIRNIDSDDQNIFKLNLNSYLSGIPDQPTITEQTRGARTNSLFRPESNYARSTVIC